MYMCALRPGTRVGGRECVAPGIYISTYMKMERIAGKEGMCCADDNK